MAHNQGMGLDEFLGHSTGSRGGGFLGNWKDKGSIVVWLHPRASIYALPSTWWKRVEVVKDDDGKKKRVIRSRRFVSHESEPVLKAQYQRKKDGGGRVKPPEVCPMSIMIETVRDLVDAGKLAWTAPVFRFEADDEVQIIHAGGMYGAFGWKNLTDEELKDLRSHNIDIRNSFKEKLYPSFDYVFSVLDEGDLGAGWQIDIERASLGDKVKEVIVKTVKGMDRRPDTSPYPFEFSYDDKKKDFGQKYDATALLKIEPTKQHKELFELEPPDVSNLIEPSSCVELRAEFERYMVVDLPLDKIFAAAEKRGLMRHEEEVPKGKDGKPLPIGEQKGTSFSPTEQDSDDEEDDDAPESDEKYDCDHCGAEAVLGPKDEACSECGATYKLLEDGSAELTARPCAECKAMVPWPPADDAGGNVICPECGTIHKGANAKGEPIWEVVQKGSKKAPAKKARSGSRAQARS